MNEFIFILSVARSGSTYLCNVLNSHKNILIVNESKMIIPFSKFINSLNSEKDFNVSPASREIAEHRRILYDIAMKNVHVIIKEFFESINKKGAIKFGEKSPLYGDRTYTRCIEKLFPNCKIIHLVRDPRAVVPSLVSRGWYDFHGAIDTWKYSNIVFDDLGRRIGSDRYILVRHEDLCINRISSVEKILKFLGEETSDDIINYISTHQTHPFSNPTSDINNSKFPYNWANKLTTEQEQTIVQQLDSMMRIYQYNT